MIYSLSGIPIRVEPFFVVLQVGAVGYGARIPGNVYEAIVAGGYDTGEKNFTLVTRSVYSEDNAQLFGFLNEHDAALFDFIRSLNGFGPQAAMNIISTIGGNELLTALRAQDAAALTKVPGVGKTKADKLCFEANAKKTKLEKLASVAQAGQKVSPAADTDDLVTQALTSLGYSLREIQTASDKVKKIADKPGELSRENLQQWIRLYLRNL